MTPLTGTLLGVYVTGFFIAPMLAAKEGALNPNRGDDIFAGYAMAFLWPVVLVAALVYLGMKSLIQMGARL